MSQAILNEQARLNRAIEALAERVGIIEQRLDPRSPYPLAEIVANSVKRGPGRPKKDASANAK